MKVIFRTEIGDEYYLELDEKQVALLRWLDEKKQLVDDVEFYVIDEIEFNQI